MGKGLPVSAEVLAVSPSEYLNEPHLVWRPLSWNEETVRFPLAVSAIPSLGERHVISGGKEAGPVLALAWLLGSGMHLSPLAGFFNSHNLIGPYFLL